MTDPFKERLLVALKEEVATRADTRPVRSHRRRWALAVGLAAVVAGAGIVGVPMLGEDPAYAVDREADGTIRVRLGWELTPADADRIEDRLEFFGVPSVVDVLGTGEDCARPRGVFVGGEKDEYGNIGGPDGLVVSETEFHDDRPRIDWRIDPDFVGEGQTLLLELHFEKAGDSEILYGDAWVMDGAVEPCVIVPGGALGN